MQPSRVQDHCTPRRLFIGLATSGRAAAKALRKIVLLATAEAL